MTMRLGGGNLVFEPVEGWEKLPEGWSFIDVAGVAVDDKDQVTSSTEANILSSCSIGTATF
jgi:hypothetical protein